MSRLTAAFIFTIVLWLLPQAIALGSESRSGAPKTAAPLAPRVEALVARMTLDEKIGQLNLVSHAGSIDGQLQSVRSGKVGAVLNVVHPDDIRAFRNAARTSRLGIPLIFGLDAVNVLRIVFPPPLAWAATWNPALAEEAAEAVARESAAVGVTWTFAPMVDVTRDPRWGRVIEGAGEDPFLAAAFAAARVRGYHKGGLATAVKHFVGYGAPEGGRDYNGASIPVSELHDRHLPPFKAALDAGSETVMAAFNTVNGVPVSANRDLLTGLLRGRWGFDGFVTSDYNAIGELVNHGVAADLGEAARKALLAGIDMDMEGNAYASHLADEVSAGRVSVEAIDEAVRRVLRVKFRLGLFDENMREAPPSTPDESWVRGIAREVARQSMVLVKNEGGMLPITPAIKTIALIGAFADSDYDSSWYGPAGLTKPATETLHDAMRKRLAPGQKLLFAKGVSDPCGKSFADEAEVVRTAEAADLVLLAVFEDCEMSGEGASRADLGLSGVQQQLLDLVAATGKPVGLIVNTGRPLALAAADTKASAVLITWHGGTEGRTALAEILTGERTPSGKLPMTFPRSVGQIPVVYSQLPTSRPPGHDRYTSRYVDEEVTPLYPFGFGLSYTSFSYSDLTLASPRIGRDGVLEVSVRVRNTGKRPGHEVVQLYTRQMVASRSRPIRELKGFAKIFLEPGEERIVNLRIAARDLGYHDDDGRLILEAGAFRAIVGGSSTATLAADFEIAGE